MIRQITGSAVTAGVAATGYVRGSVIDTAATAGGWAVAARSNRHASVARLVLENSVIRGSGGIGAAATNRAELSLLGVRIEGSAGTGIYTSNGPLPWDIGGLGELRAPIRVTGGATYPADISLWAAGRLTALQPVDSLLGNGLSDVRAVRSRFGLGTDAVVRRVLSEEPAGAFALSTGDVEDLTIVGSTTATTEPGLTINGAVTINRCEITAMRADAVRVTASASPRITACNLVDNDGVGVRNVGTGRVDARGNWWGDAAGPLGPRGDGVAGAVDWEPFLTAPAPRPVRP